MSEATATDERSDHGPSRRVMLAGIGGLAAGAVLAGRAQAGPLSPPPGPIAPTPGPEPRIPVSQATTPGSATAVFRISQPGSYYLTGNVTGVTGKHGIEIAVNGVTLDLNGFPLKGVAGSLDGVSVQSLDARGVMIRNGSIQSWGDCGIEFQGLGGRPAAGVIADVDASLNARIGILTGDRARVERCTTDGNGGDGISVFAGSTIADCAASFNGGDGFRATSGCVIVRSTSSANTGNGFSLGTGNSISGCTAYDNTIGFASADASAIANCTAYSNTSDGFELFSSNTVTNCSSHRNGGIGFNAVLGSSSIIDSTASLNDGDGIRVSTNSIVRGNLCSGNGNGGTVGAGIRVSGSDNRIEDNNCIDADRGIDVDAAGNFIVRNTCSGHTTNWTIASGNACLVVAFAAAPAINGDFGGISPGSTNPFANYTY